MTSQKSTRNHLMNIKSQIQTKLLRALQPIILEIEDQSHRHQGHAGWRETGETHFHIKLASSKFVSLNRVQRHKLVYSALSPEPMNSIHALSMELSDGTDHEK